MFNFKELFAGVALIFLLGIGGFLYRTAIESSYQNVGVCSFETKTCPNGALVGRSGRSCTFTKCVPPNVELSAEGIAFVLPAGYTLLPMSSSTPSSRIATYTKNILVNASTTTSTLTLYRYTIAKGQTPAEVIRAHAPLTSSRIPHPSSMKAFTSVTLGTTTFSHIILEKSALVQRSAYYVVHAQHVFRFDVTESSTALASSSLKIDNSIGNKALRSLLATLQFST